MAEEPQGMYVFVWKSKMINGGWDCGHASISVGKAYASIWPQGQSFLVGKAIPVPSSLVSPDVDDEYHAEEPGNAQNALAAARLATHSETEMGESGKPDFVFCMEGLDEDAAKTEMARIAAGVRDGKIGYQFLPNVSFQDTMTSLDLRTIQMMTADEFSGQVFQYAVDQVQAASDREGYAEEGFNCTTLTAHVLASAGLELPPSWAGPFAVFGYDPTHLAALVSAAHPYVRLVYDSSVHSVSADINNEYGEVRAERDRILACVAPLAL